MLKSRNLLSSTALKPVVGLLGVAAIATGLNAAPASAAEFEFFGIEAQFDTTLTAGATFRTQDQDSSNVGIANGGSARSINGDDGNLNYDPGIVSLAVSANHELDLQYENYGAFVRFGYLYDFFNANRDSTEFRDLPDNSVQRVGRRFDLFDAYVTASYEVGDDMPLDFRVGNQVLSWGESTFIQNGINVINPIDVSRLRVPGSQIRDALTPVPIFDVNLGVTDNLSVEAFYQFLWDETEPEANGTFFSTTDIASPGSSQVFLGFGNPLVPDIPQSITTPVTPLGSRAVRAGDDEPDDHGQFGIAARYFSPELNDTEFGAYFINYHSRLPVISGVTGTQADLVGAAASDFAAGSEYFLEYPEDIQLLGASFNTTLDSIGLRGMSLQGEYSYKFNQPLQIDDVELLQAVVAPGAIAGACSADPTSPTCQGTIQAFNTNQVIQKEGGIGLANLNSFFGREIEGFEEFDVSQFQMTATQLFGPNLGANQVVVLGEAGFTYIHGLDSGERLEGPGTYVGGNPVLAGPEGFTTNGFGDRFSWGYVLAARADYLNAIGAVNLSPSIAFSHNVSGTTPAPLGNFVEGRKAISLGLTATYQNQLSMNLQYTNFFGGSEFNLLRDRDFASISISYSF
ncbi:MAG: DUF1302 domain-containing protein [Pseudomonadota bacterium]